MTFQKSTLFRLNNIETKDVDQDAILATLNTVIAQINDNVAALGTDITSLNDEFTALTTGLTSLETKVETQQTELDSVQVQVTGQQTELDSQQQTLLSVLTTLTSIMEDLDSQASAIAGMQSDIQAIKDQLQEPPPPPNERFPGDPGVNKLYYGMSTYGGDPAGREAFFGHKIGIFRSYASSPNVAASVAVCKRDLDNGRVPFHSTKLPGTWADMAAGKFDDSFVIPLFAGLAALDGPVWLCYNHEPFDDIGTGQQASDYKAMYKHIYGLKPVNVAITPILQAFPFDPNALPPQTHNVLDWYDPTALDIVGIDNYNHKSFNPANGLKWRSADQVISGICGKLDVIGKPIAIAEYGVRTDPATPGAAAQWLQDAYDISAARGNIVAMCYFDSGLNVNDGGSSWSLDDQGTERLDKFKTLVTSSSSAFLTA